MPFIPLDDLADVRTGYTLRGKSEPGPIRLVHIADLAASPEGVLDPSRVATTADVEPGTEHRLRAGDVLLASRGERNPAALVEASLPGVVATSHLYMIRVTDSRLDPGYLAWYLNTRPAQDFFDAHAHGTYAVRRIRRDDVGALPVPLAPPEVQRAVARASRAAHAEAALARDHADRRLALAEGLLLQTATDSAR